MGNKKKARKEKEKKNEAQPLQKQHTEATETLDEGGFNWEPVPDEQAHFAALAEANDFTAFTKFHVLRLVQGAGAFPVGQSLQSLARRRHGKAAKKLIEFIDTKCGTAADKDLVHPHNDEKSLPDNWDVLKSYCEAVAGRADDAYDRHMLGAPVMHAMNGDVGGFMDLCLCSEREQCRVMAILACAPEWSACSCCSNFFPVYNPDNVYMSAAFIAVYHGYVEYLKILDSVPYDVWRENRLVNFLLDARQDDCFHPFRVATQRGHEDVLRYLAAWDPESGSTGYMDLLVMLSPSALGERLEHIAAKEGHMGCLRYFVDLMPECVYNETGDGQTLAHVAAEYGRGDVIDLLHEVGAGRLFSQKNRHAITPAHVACRSGHFRVLSLLARLGGVGVGDTLVQPDCRGWTPAHICAQGGHTACVRELRRLGVQQSFTLADKHEMTPIHHAAKHNMAQTLVALTEHLSPEDRTLGIEAQDANGWTPSMHTVARLSPDGRRTSSRTCLDAARALHSLGGWQCLAGKVDKKFGRNVAHFVVEHKNRQMLDFFISGADKMPAEYFEVEDSTGRQPIHIAVDHRDGVAVVLLRTMKCGGSLQNDKDGQMMCEDWLREFMEFVAPNMGLEVPKKKEEEARPLGGHLDGFGMRDIRDTGKEIIKTKARIALAKRKLEKERAEEERKKESEAARARTSEEADRAAALLLEEEREDEERKRAAKAKSDKKAKKKAEEREREREEARRKEREEEERREKEKEKERQAQMERRAAREKEKERERERVRLLEEERAREIEREKEVQRKAQEERERKEIEEMERREREEREREEKEREEMRLQREKEAREREAREGREREEREREEGAAAEREERERLERERVTEEQRDAARERARHELERRHREEREHFERQTELQRQTELRVWEERDARELLELERERELEMFRMMEDERHAPPLVYAPHVAARITPAAEHRGGGDSAQYHEALAYMPWLQDSTLLPPQPAGSHQHPKPKPVGGGGGEADRGGGKPGKGAGSSKAGVNKAGGSKAQANPECIVCWERPALCVASPCGHQIMCKECAGIKPPLFSECPMCRVPMDCLMHICEAQKRGLRVFAI